MNPETNNWIREILETDKVIHEPARVVILSLLNAVKEVDFVFLMNQTGLTQGNLSSHLSKLEGAGYIEIEKTFAHKRPKTLIRINAQGKAAFDEYVAGLKKFLHALE